MNDKALRKRITETLAQLRLEDLRLAWMAFDLGQPPKLPKAGLVDELAELLSWPDETAFRAFFASLTDALREAIQTGSFERFVDAPPLEKRYGITIIERTKSYSYEYGYSIAKGSRFGFFRVYNESTLVLLEPFRIAFAERLPKPVGYHAEPLTEVPDGAWNNEEAVYESLPLALAAIAPLVAANKDGTLARKGLKKAQLQALRAACDYQTFPLASGYGLDALELLARYLAAMLYKPPRKPSPPDGFEFLKATLATFLDQPKGEYYESYSRGPALEMALLSDHLSGRPGHRLDTGFQSPGRATFAAALRQAAQDTLWRSADEVVRAIRYQDHPLGFVSQTEERYALALKGESLEHRGATYEDRYSDAITIEPRLHDRLVAGPTFKAYCYLMAALGVVEIAEREPPLDLERKGKRVPVCAYDCLYAFRVTALGRYVLGFSDEKPSEPVRVFEAIADPELPLIAFRGRSLERRLFIESIGEPLGSERFRVTDASFSSGCSDAKAVARKVADFRRLIGQKPAPHWERLFSRTQAKASALGKPGHAYVFKAPAEPEVLRALIEAPSLRGLYARAEGGLLVVQAADYKKFIKAVEALGFRPEEP